MPIDPVLRAAATAAARLFRDRLGTLMAEAPAPHSAEAALLKRRAALYRSLAADMDHLAGRAPCACEAAR